MKQHRNTHRVLMVATACLYHLVRGDLSKTMHVSLLADMVQLVLHGIEIASDQPVHFQVVTLPKNLKCNACTQTFDHYYPFQKGITYCTHNLVYHTVDGTITLDKLLWSRPSATMAMTTVTRQLMTCLSQHAYTCTFNSLFPGQPG